MEVRHLLDRAPVAAVEGVRADQVESAGDRPAAARGEDEQDAVRHKLAEQREEAAGEVGAAPFARAGFLVEGPEGVPVRFGNGGAADMLDRQPRERRRAFL